MNSSVHTWLWGSLLFGITLLTKVAVMLREEGGGPLSKLLSGGNTSTNSVSHPIPCWAMTNNAHCRTTRPSAYLSSLLKSLDWVAAPIFNGFLTVVEGDRWCVWTCVGCINWTESRLGTSTVWFCCLALTSPLLSSTCRRRCMESWLIMAQTLLMWRDIS